MPLGVICDTIKRKEFILNIEKKDHKRSRKLIKTGKIDTVRFDWINAKRRLNFIISDDMVKNMALKFAEHAKIFNFKASNGWLQTFKNRYHIKSSKICGEEGCVDMNRIREMESKLKGKLLNYDPHNVINCDETGLFFKLPQNKTLILSKGDRASGKFSKERVTLLFFVGLDGQKYNPLIIGKFKNPRDFKNLNLEKMQIKYINNKKAWMSLAIFNETLNEMNNLFKNENRKVLLILDNAPVHPVSIELSNIELFYLPPNTTAKVQPLDQGIIYSFKSNYKKFLNRKLFMQAEDSNLTFNDLLKKITLLDSVYLIVEAWKSVSNECVINCFNKALKNFNILSDKSFDNTDEIHYEQNDFTCYDPALDDKDVVEDEGYFMKYLCDIEDFKEDHITCEEDITAEPTIQSCAAFIMAEKLERYFSERQPEDLELIYKLKESILKERKSIKAKTLFFINANVEVVLHSK